MLDLSRQTKGALFKAIALGRISALSLTLALSRRFIAWQLNLLSASKTSAFTHLLGLVVALSFRFR